MYIHNALPINVQEGGGSSWSCSCLSTCAYSRGGSSLNEEADMNPELRPTMLLSSLVHTRSMELVLAPIASQVSEKNIYPPYYKRHYIP